MNDNIRIAKQLVAMARMLVAASSYSVDDLIKDDMAFSRIGKKASENKWLKMFKMELSDEKKQTEIVETIFGQNGELIKKAAELNNSLSDKYRKVVYTSDRSNSYWNKVWNPNTDEYLDDLEEMKAAGEEYSESMKQVASILDKIKNNVSTAQEKYKKYSFKSVLNYLDTIITYVKNEIESHNDSAKANLTFHGKVIDTIKKIKQNKNN